MLCCFACFTLLFPIHHALLSNEWVIIVLQAIVIFPHHLLHGRRILPALVIAGPPKGQ